MFFDFIMEYLVLYLISLPITYIILKFCIVNIFNVEKHEWSNGSSLLTILMSSLSIAAIALCLFVIFCIMTLDEDATRDVITRLVPKKMKNAFYEIGLRFNNWAKKPSKF